MIQAVIFDLDGVISDTQKIKTQTSVDLLFEKYGVEMTHEDYEEKYAGMKTKQIFKDIFDIYNINDDLNKFIEQRIDLLNQSIEKEVPLVPGSLDLVDYFKSQNLRLALASGGMRYWVDLILKKLNIKNKFEVIAYSDEVEFAKPDPEIYELAAEKLNIKPEYCLVIEDAKNGMIAAKAAGMKCVGLVENTQDKSYPADILISNLKDFKLIESQALI
jgi:HAD superfamily hydrolase (TIGR01509 family)